MSTNREGLTFEEWLSAAFWPDIEVLKLAYSEWSKGVDPTEYRVPEGRRAIETMRPTPVGHLAPETTIDLKAIENLLSRGFGGGVMLGEFIFVRDGKSARVQIDMFQKGNSHDPTLRITLLGERKEVSRALTVRPWKEIN